MPPKKVCQWNGEIAPLTPPLFLLNLPSTSVGFVIGFLTSLLRWMDYSRIYPDQVTRLSDIVVERCVSRLSGSTLLCFLLFCVFYVWQIMAFVLSIMWLVDMYRFYTYLQMPDSHPGLESTHRSLLTLFPPASEGAELDAHDIANRIMRRFFRYFVGQEELDSRSGSVNVRNRDDVGTKAKMAMVPLNLIIDKLVRLKASRSLQNVLPE
ncbi:hypothetical protein BJV78DRAFT_1278089 [Lactifluus subvellereus]|nr:hypothetical protein BJV78DRAFT_1278089 [Lactifluus subvellereus]